MNTDLLLQIADAIEANPTHFDMSNFIDYDTYRGGYHTAAPATVDEFLGRCDTTACVAGWASVLSGETFSSVSESMGRLLLNLSRRQAERLFYCDEDTVWYEEADYYGWDVTKLSIDGDENWSDIKGHEAADLLRRIAAGEVVL